MGLGLARDLPHCEAAKRPRQSSGSTGLLRYARNNGLDAERRSAAAARLGVGVGDAEGGAGEVLDEIDRRTAHQVEARWIDHQLDAVGLSNRVIGLCGLREFERVR